MTDTNFSDLEVEREIQAATNAFVPYYQNSKCTMRMCSRHHLIHLNARQEAEKPLLHHLLNSRHRWQDGIPDVEVLIRSRADVVTLEALITSYHLFSASLGRKC